ncbi:MAG: hypothetical protein ACLRS8_14750 [Parabacteroides merdae]
MPLNARFGNRASDKGWTCVCVIRHRSFLISWRRLVTEEADARVATERPHAVALLGTRQT